MISPVLFLIVAAGGLYGPDVKPTLEKTLMAAEQKVYDNLVKPFWSDFEVYAENILAASGVDKLDWNTLPPLILDGQPEFYYHRQYDRLVLL